MTLDTDDDDDNFLQFYIQIMMRYLMPNVNLICVVEAVVGVALTV